MFKIIYSTIALPTLAAIGVLWATNPVMAISVDFSFTGTKYTATTNTYSPNSTVTGIINGLQLNATETPSDIVVYTNQIGLPSGTDQTSVSGTVTLDSNGNVTGISELMAINYFYGDVLDLNDNGENLLYSYEFGFEEEYNTGGFAGVTYTPSSTSVPWEGEAALVPTMSGAILIPMRRRRSFFLAQASSKQ